MSTNKKSTRRVNINQPSPGSRKGAMFSQEDVVLDHPRKVLWNWLGKYFFAKKNKKKVFLSFFLISSATILGAFHPVIIALLIDYGIRSKNIPYVMNMGIIYIVIMIILIFENYFGTILLTKISQNIIYSIRIDIFAQLQKCSMQYYDKRPSGEIVSISTNNVDALSQFFGGQLSGIISSILVAIFYTIFMFILNTFLAILSLIIVPIYLLLTRLIRKLAGTAFRDTQKSIAKVTVRMQENITGAKVMQAYGQEEKEKKRFDEANFQNYAANLRIRRVFSFIFPLIGTISSLITITVILIGSLVGLDFMNVVIAGVEITVTPGALTAFISYLASFFRPFMMLMQFQQIQLMALTSADSIKTLLEEQVEIHDPDAPKYFNEKVKGKLEFDNVSFGYKMEDLLLDDDFGVSIDLQDKSMKRLLKAIKKYPEPYSSFIIQNLQNLPSKLGEKIIKNIAIIKPKKAPSTLDKILGEFKCAVPNTELSRNNPRFRTQFPPREEKTEKTPQLINNGILVKKTPDEIVEQLEQLEQLLRKQKTLQQPSRSSRDNQGSRGSNRTRGFKPEQHMLEYFAKMKIPDEIYEKLPKIVQDAIKEKRTRLRNEETIGYVLKNVDLNVSSGNTLAIVGETGAGKSTLVKLIARFYDLKEKEGKILLDDIKIQDVTKKDLRDLLGLVPQDAFLFDGTVKENLLYAMDDTIKDPSLNDKMINVSKFLGLHNFIEALPDKYETHLIENGSNISIGQRQLIAFARALIMDPKILILDEATSSVDPYTETLIQDALNRAREGRTTIIIAHRLSTIKNADHIIVLDKEKRGIVEQGSHESLLNLNGRYKHLLDMQHMDIKTEK
ncbi:MAG: ABC transporter transmembrane domain-containing protein [Promethearchaeota archaeon]